MQLDNKAPEISDIQIPGGACDTFGPGDMPIMVSANFSDAHFWRYNLKIFGGNPPVSYGYGWVDHNGPTPDGTVDGVGPTGTGGLANLHKVDVNDLVSSSVITCCYGVRLRMEDRTIHGGFGPSTNALPWGLGYEIDKEITFAYIPSP